MEPHRSVGLDPPTLRRADIVAATGVPAERNTRWWRAMGFPEVGDDVVAFNRQDLDLVRRVGDLETAGLVEDDEVARHARLLGASFQRIAEAQLNLVDDLLVDDPEIMKLLEQTVVYVWKRHMLAALGRRVDAVSDPEHADVLAVGFADLAGFTKLSKTLSSAGLTELIDGFEAAAFETVAPTDGRVVKLIGDEVMWVAPTLATAARIGLDLRDRLAEIEGMPTVRVGIAVGSTVDVGGDVFGTTVNLASRLTTIARKGTVVVPRDHMAELAEEPDLVVRPSRRSYALKGIGDTRIAVVGRAPAED